MSDVKPGPLGLRWEDFGTLLGDAVSVGQPHFLRAKVPGGWLLRPAQGENPSMTFIPDVGHDWTLEVGQTAVRPPFKRG